MRYEIKVDAWAIVRPMLRNKLRGVPRVSGPCALNGIRWVLHSGGHGAIVSDKATIP